ncbi:MAG: alpha/beta fold hydrolase [Nitrospirota bacterium]
MKKFIICILIGLCFLSSKVNAEELTWGSCTTYAPMPVLFIHGINANALTWEEAIPQLEKYFGYREVRFNKPAPGGLISNYPDRKGATWFQYPDSKIESPAKLYLEAFDYGGEDRSGSIKPIKSNYDELRKKIEEILQAYYGDEWEKEKLIIVGHSQGGLLSRYYLQQSGGNKVKRFITIGTPHTGSMLAPLAWGMVTFPFINSPYNYIVTGGGIWIGKKKYGWNLLKEQIKSMITLKGAPCDLVPWSKFIKEVNTTDMPPGIEYICIVGKSPLHAYDEEKGKVVPVPDKYIDSDTVVSERSQRSEYKGQQTIPWDEIITIADGDKGAHGNSPKQHDKILQSLDGIPDKGTRTYDTPRVTLGTYTFAPGTNTLYSKTPANDFYITGKIYDYLPGSCTVTVEIDSAGNYANDNDGQVKDRGLIKAINMNTETQEEPKTHNLLNARFNFHPTNSLSAGMHSFRLTVMNPGSVTGTATTKDNKDWIPFEITEYVVEVLVQKSASPATPVAAGMQASSALNFWDNQDNYWERWINSNLRVDADNIIRYNAGTSNLDNPNLRHRVYLESRIDPAGSNQPKASCVNKKETQAITYTFASQPFKLLPYTKEDGSVVYRPDVNEDGTITYPADMVTFTNNEVVFTPKKDALPNLNFGAIVPGNPMYTYPDSINIPPTYNGVSSNLLDTYINQVGPIYSLESVQKGYDYSLPLSADTEFNPTINIAYVQNVDLTPDSITCFGSNSAGSYRTLINSDRQDEFNDDKVLQAFGNALLTNYKEYYYQKLGKRHYEEGFADYKLSIAPLGYTMNPDEAFVDGFCMRFSAAVRGTSIVELPVKQKGVLFDLAPSTHRGTTSALAIAQGLYRVPMQKIWQALETPTLVLNHSGYTILDLLNELDAQGYNTNALRTEFFSTTQPPSQPRIISSGMEPNSGTAGTTFTFRIKYQDESGMPPAGMALRIEGTQLRQTNQDEYDWIWEYFGQKPEWTNEIEGSPFSLKLIDGTISTGATYEAKVKLTKADTYTYWFDVVDGLGISPLQTAKTQFKVSPASLNRLEVTPNSAILPITGEVEFEAKGYDEFGNETEVIGNRWSVIGNIGTLSAISGTKTTFIAGNTVGTGTLICSSLLPPLSSLATIEVVLGGPVYIKGGEVSGRWTKGGSPYIITDNICVPKGKTLRIDPGVTVKFHYYIAQWNDAFLDWLIPPEIVRRKLTVEGNLLAEGTEQEPIIFTSISDGGTNTPAEGGTGTPCFGDWDKLIFEQGSTGKLKHCVIKYAGYADWWYNDIIAIEPAVLIKSKDVQLSNCLVTNKGGSARRSSKLQGIGIVINSVIGNQLSVIGIRDSVVENCWGGIVVKNSSGVQLNNNTVKNDGSFGMQVFNSAGIKFLTNTVTNCSDAAFSQDLSCSEIEYRGNTATGTAFNLIWLADNFPADKEVILKKADLPYGFNALHIPQGGTLRIEPGAKFVLTRFGHIGEELRDVGKLIVEGRLMAEGTPEDEIIFDKGGFGNWNYIKFIGPNASASSLKYCKVISGGRRDSGSYIGESSVITGALWLSNSTPKIEYCKIQDTKVYDDGYQDCGIRLENLPAGYVLANNTFSNCTKGVAVYNCPNPPVIASNTLTNNTYCFYQEPNSFPEYHGNIFKDNEYTVILTGRSPRVYGVGVSEIWVFTGCEITVPKAVWKEAGLAYAIDGYIRVNKGSTLVIEPGVIIKPINICITGGGSIDVQGELIAEGSQQAKIIFTSINDDARHTPNRGDWSTLNFSEGSRGTLTHCIVKYGAGGVFGGSEYQSAVRIDKSTVSISDSIITLNSNSGIYINNGSPTISNTTVSHNRVHGIVCDNYSAPIIQNGTISYNGQETAVDNHGIVCKNYSNAVISNNVISGNYGGGVAHDVNSFPVYTGNKLSGNKYDIGIFDGEMMVSGTWTNLGTQTTYVLIVENRNVVIKKGVTLEIEPGVITKYYMSNIGWNAGGILVKGRLLAKGTKELPIVFTSFFDDSYGGDTDGRGGDFPTNQWNAYWTGVKFDQGEGIMEDCILRYSNGSSILVNNAAPTIQRCYISNGSSYGIDITNNSSPIIKENIITCNLVGVRVLDVLLGYIPEIKHNFIYNNTAQGLEVTRYYLPNNIDINTITVTYNWWGHPTGPNHPNNSQGKGDKISDYYKIVIFNPWIGKDFIISPKSGTVGSLVSICGSGLEPSISLGIIFGITGTVSSFTTDSYGSFTAGFPVPIEKAGEKEISIGHPKAGKMLFGSFTITASELDYLKINPENVVIGCGGNYDFQVQGYDKRDNPIPNLSYRWQILPNLGVISPTTGYWTIFKAGSAATTGIITVTSGSFTAMATVTLSAAPPQYPKTGTIVFLRGAEGSGTIWIMNAAGGQLQKVNIQQTKAPYYPRLSKNAKLLAYGAGNKEREDALYVHNLLTGTETVLENNYVPAWGWMPLYGWDWNEKGDRIYYHYYYDYADIYRISTDGKNKEKIKIGYTPWESQYSPPRISYPKVNPQEDLLLGINYDVGIRLYNLCGTVATFIREAAVVYPGMTTEALFSPDGKRIAYIDNNNQTQINNLWLMSLDGMMKRRVTTNGATYPFAFSPDGTRLIYPRAGELWVINLDGTGEQNITNTPDIDERHVDWVSGIAPMFTMDVPKSAPMVEKLAFPEDLTNAFVYPNPTDGKKLIFTNLTKNVRIRIFTVVGEEVFEIEVETPSNPGIGKWTWNCRGSEGQRLASGIYIYLLTNDKGQKKTGKLGIVR